MILSQNQNDEDKQKKIPYHFGEKLRQVREKKGYTLKVVAQKAGVSESLVSRRRLIHCSLWPMFWTLIWNFFLKNTERSDP